MLWLCCLFRVECYCLLWALQPISRFQLLRDQTFVNRSSTGLAKLHDNFLVSRRSSTADTTTRFQELAGPSSWVSPCTLYPAQCCFIEYKRL